MGYWRVRYRHKGGVQSETYYHANIVFVAVSKSSILMFTNSRLWREDIYKPFYYYHLDSNIFSFHLKMTPIKKLLCHLGFHWWGIPRFKVRESLQGMRKIHTRKCYHCPATQVKVDVVVGKRWCEGVWEDLR